MRLKCPGGGVTVKLALDFELARRSATLPAAL
jgi:hypothetical protein